MWVLWDKEGIKVTLLLNTFGAVELLKKAKTNKEIIESLNRLTYEFYRTMGILFYARYLAVVSEKLISTHSDVIDLVKNQFERPTFEAWVHLGKICSEHLHTMGDRFAQDYAQVAKLEVEETDRNRMRLILEILAERDDSTSPAIPERITFPAVLRIMTKVVELAKARIFFQDALDSLIDNGLHQIVLSTIERIMEKVGARILVPLSMSKHGIETKTLGGSVSDVVTHPVSSKYTRFLYATYFQYYEDEAPFQFRSNMLYYERAMSSCYVYVKHDKDHTTVEYLCPESDYKRREVDLGSLDDILDIPHEISIGYESYLTLKQRFGRTHSTNEIVHNLSPRLPKYVRRRRIEEALVHNLSRRKFYITTLDGGGGFGKTELARTTIWDIVESTKEMLPLHLQFEYIIWITGAREHFKDGQIHTRPQQLGSIEDVMDSILYVTNNIDAIAQSMDIKRKLVVESLDQSKSTLLVLDNLETVAEMAKVWNYIVSLVESVKSELRVITTSRVRVGVSEQLITIRKMEDDEARELALIEMERLDVDKKWQSEENIRRLMESTGSIPLLILYFILLISRDYDFNDIISKLPDDSDMALEFMCGMQWSTLEMDARKLLTAIAYWEGKMNFSQAKTLCGFSEGAFNVAKEQLVLHSFPVEHPLVDSVLEILPPIAMFAKEQLKKHPEFENDFMNNESLLRTPLQSRRAKAEINLREDVELNRLFQRADLMARQGATYIAYDTYKQATDRFPKSVSAWQRRGEFEYKFLRDASEGNASFRQASLHDPTDSATYELWAYWEFESGSKIPNKAHVKRSVILYNEAITLAQSEIDRKRILSAKALSDITLGDLTRSQLRKESSSKAESLAREADSYYVQTIDTLERNLYEETQTDLHRYHNATVYAILSQAYLSLKLPQDKDRTILDDCAILFMIRGLQTDRTSPRIRSYIKRYDFMRALKRRVKAVSEKDKMKNIISAILGLEERVRGACQQARPVLRVKGS